MQDKGLGTSGASSHPTKKMSRDRSHVEGIYCCGDSLPLTLCSGKSHWCAKQGVPCHPGTAHPCPQARQVRCSGLDEHGEPRPRGDGEGQWPQRQPVDAVHGELLRWVGVEGALVEEDGSEEEELELGKLVADAAPLAGREDHHTAGPVTVQALLLVQESRGVEALGLRPLAAVVVD